MNGNKISLPFLIVHNVIKHKIDGFVEMQAEMVLIYPAGLRRLTQNLLDHILPALVNIFQNLMNLQSSCKIVAIDIQFIGEIINTVRVHQTFGYHQVTLTRGEGTKIYDVIMGI